MHIHAKDEPSDEHDGAVSLIEFDDASFDPLSTEDPPSGIESQSPRLRCNDEHGNSALPWVQQALENGQRQSTESLQEQRLLSVQYNHQIAQADAGQPHCSSLDSSQVFADDEELLSVSEGSTDSAVLVLPPPPPQPKSCMKKERPQQSDDSCLNIDRSIDPYAVGSEANLDARLFLTCLKGNIEELSQCLEQRADPNVCCDGKVEVKGKAFTHCSPLALAVLRADMSMINLLIQSKADFRSSYGFKAGIEQHKWSGPAIYAAVPSGRLDIIKAMADLQADLNAVSSNNANLVWQASYFGHVGILQHLIANDVHIHGAATSQDNCNLSYSPIHAAARAGHVGIIKELASAKAMMEKQNEDGFTPMDDAIEHEHVDAVRLLVEVHANLVQSKEDRESCQSASHVHHIASKKRRFQSMTAGIQRSERHKNAIEHLFHKNNAVVIAAAAEGLRKSPEQTRLLNQEYVLQFLETPGDAPKHIMAAIFRPVSIVYLEPTKKKRVSLKSAYLSNRGWARMNVGEGPDPKMFADDYHNKKSPEEEVMAFLDSLAPQHPKDKTSKLSLISTFHCTVANIHKNPRILDAIANVPCPNWFRDPGVQALAELNWHKVSKLVYCDIIMHCIQILIMGALAVKWNEDIGPSPQVLAFMLVPLYCWGIWSEICHVCALGVAYLRCIGNWIDASRVVVECSFLVDIIVMNKKDTDSASLRPKAAMISVFVWLTLLYSLKSLAWFGRMVVPIIRAQKSLLGICMVVAFYLAAFVHGYYAIGSYTDVRLVVEKVWRLGVLADFDLGDLVNRNQIFDSVGNGNNIYWEERDPVKSESDHYVELGFYIASFAFTIVMMNIFIGVLTTGYQEAYRDAWNVFLQERVNTAVAHTAVRHAFKRLCCKRPTPKNAITFLYYVCCKDESVDLPAERINNLSAGEIRQIFQEVLSHNTRDLRQEVGRGISEIHASIEELKGTQEKHMKQLASCTRIAQPMKLRRQLMQFDLHVPSSG